MKKKCATIWGQYQYSNINRLLFQVPPDWIKSARKQLFITKSNIISEEIETKIEAAQKKKPLIN
jgi:hypothetical protein